MEGQSEALFNDDDSSLGGTDNNANNVVLSTEENVVVDKKKDGDTPSTAQRRPSSTGERNHNRQRNSSGRKNGNTKASKEPNEKSDSSSGDVINKYKCPHFARKCDFYTPCCNKEYKCRFCHDKFEDHTLTRDQVHQVVCGDCRTRQDIQQNCQNCNLQFGRYFCKVCKCFDDDDKKQFHCVGCRICRVGGRENFFHCDGCGMCLPNSLKDDHTCRANLSHVDCPVCMEDIHTSKQYSRIPPCQHLIHVSCFDKLIANRMYNCPVCCKSMLDMKSIWSAYDDQILENPMPQKFKNVMAKILCRDCQTRSLVDYHFLALKCSCGSYNTVRETGPLFCQEGDKSLQPLSLDFWSNASTATVEEDEEDGSCDSEENSSTPIPSDDEDFDLMANGMSDHSSEATLHEKEE